MIRPDTLGLLLCPRCAADRVPVPSGKPGPWERMLIAELRDARIDADGLGAQIAMAKAFLRGMIRPGPGRLTANMARDWLKDPKLYESRMLNGRYDREDAGFSE